MHVLHDTIGPSLSCHKPLFQSEVKCEAIDMKMVFYLMKMKLIIRRKVLHLTSFESEVFWNLEMAYF